MNKEELIDKICEAGLGNSILSIYYKTGGALPFVAQRFPDGRVSRWYKSQCALVCKVIPGGKSGKYGKAYGFYYKDGKREDSSWCKKDDVEPQEIPSASCGSWVLLDILGEAITEPTKKFGLTDKLDLGVYKGMTLVDVVHKDWEWVKWAMHNEHFSFNWDDVMAERQKDIKVLHPNDVLEFGIYKGKTLKEIAQNDYYYLVWFDKNQEDFEINFEELNDLTKGIKILFPDDKLPFGKYKGKKIRKIAEKDIGYLRWLDSQREDFKINFEELNDSTKEIKILSLDDKLSFGKYKGKRIREIAKKDLGYLKWLDTQSEYLSIDFEELKLE